MGVFRLICRWSGTAFLLAMLSIANPSTAAVLVTPAAGELVVTGITNGTSFIGFDIRGLALLGVSDVVNSIPLGGVLLGDYTGGTDAAASTIPFGNQYLVGSNGTPGVAIIGFADFANLSFAGPVLNVPMYFGPLAGVVPSGSTLSALVGASPIPFSFKLKQVVNFGQGSVAQWSYQSTAVPEPSFAGLCLVLIATGIGLAKRTNVI